MSHKMLVMAKAVLGKVDELATWYDEQHFPDLLRLDGIVAAERYSVMPLKRPEGATDWDFFLVYELKGDDPTVALKEMAVAEAEGRFRWSDVLDRQSTTSIIATLSKAQGG